ncbi:hypothetical protein J6590_071357 [Homalodisca vitripennis]|nr:hypothetical protein J6590_071357 [Homalodisca vitripennis]
MEEYGTRTRGTAHSTIRIHGLSVVGRSGLPSPLFLSEVSDHPLRVAHEELLYCEVEPARAGSTLFDSPIATRDCSAPATTHSLAA